MVFIDAKNKREQGNPTLLLVSNYLSILYKSDFIKRYNIVYFSNSIN